MPVKITDRFATTCSTVFANNYDTCGTITRSSIAHLTPTLLESLFSSGGLFADLDAWFKTSIEMKACGTRTYGLYDWIMSGADRTKGKAALSVSKAMGNPSLLFPFILGRQDSVINTDYWAITTGMAQSAYTAGVTGNLDADDLATGAASDRVIRVVSRYGVDLDDKWFNPRTVVHIFSKRGNGKFENGAWKVLASATATDKTSVDVLVTTQNAGSAGLFDATPDAGVLIIGQNNVNDFESWCNNLPNYDGRKRTPFWIQTMRRTRCVDSEYQKFFARLMESEVNRGFQEFGDIPMAKRNAQDELEYKKRFCTAFFFNKPISANQTLAAWESLESINTASSSALTLPTEGKLIARRANFIGIYEQALACSRVKDLAGQPLNMIEFFDINYALMRARETTAERNIPVMDIDWYTDSVFAATFQDGMIKYYKEKYLDQMRFEQNISSGSNDLGMLWTSYRVPFPAKVRINIITHEWFDDFRDANKTENQESAGTFLWALDLGSGGSIYWSQIAANRKVHTIGELEALAKIDSTFSCVMETITQQQTLISETGTAVMECPNNNLFCTNLGSATPITTGRQGPSYVDLY